MFRSDHALSLLSVYCRFCLVSAFQPSAIKVWPSISLLLFLLACLIHHGVWMLFIVGRLSLEYIRMSLALAHLLASHALLSPSFQS